MCRGPVDKSVSVLVLDNVLDSDKLSVTVGKESLAVALKVWQEDVGPSGVCLLSIGGDLVC